MTGIVTVRRASEDDAAALAALALANRAFLAPWEPVRPDAYFTEEQQRATLRGFAAQDPPLTVPCVILVDGEPAGRINVNNVVRGAFWSADLGYWVAQEHNGRGVGTVAVAGVLRLAFGELGLHRVQAATLLHNTGSQRVLERNGFTRIGVAPRYLRIAGEWQDHVLFQRLAD
ncbi:GNAT family N-acetyltransferase [Petropleomorpha daqingensis]|uniref:Ribosomal-protein-alanine N-acetyltransferase n=1 Tax=Petropleomorpha daqingensis TaxID=2026353 RepID=A0A853CKR6_9ACTN|nr:ribosomal-protein-alanine N-acetyltransferase [Petropleomorpha daqingensis]